MLARIGKQLWRFAGDKERKGKKKGRPRVRRRRLLGRKK